MPCFAPSRSGFDGLADGCSSAALASVVLMGALSRLRMSGSARMRETTIKYRSSSGTLRKTVGKAPQRFC